MERTSGGEIKKEELDNIVSDEQEPKTELQMDCYEDKPSDKTIPKCEFIVKEFEEIAISFTTLAINREILWQQMRKRCEGNLRFKLAGKRDTSIIEIATGNQWDREGLKHHMDNVIKWHKHHNPQLYS